MRYGSIYYIIHVFIPSPSLLLFCTTLPTCSTSIFTLREQVERVQRANFIHFLVLCLVPTALLIIVVAAIVSKDSDCGTVGLTTCEMEPRSFTNAFTSACICDAVRITSSVTEEDEDNPF